MPFTYTAGREKGAGKSTGAARMKTQRNMYREQVKALKVEIRELKERLAAKVIVNQHLQRGTPVQSEEYTQGEAAYRAGTSLLDNPYQRPSPEWSDWRNGWTSAQREDEGS